MTLAEALRKRAGGACELCGGDAGLAPYDLTPEDARLETSVLLCEACRSRIAAPGPMPSDAHWYGLKTSMWSEHAAVQALVYRVLRRLGDDALAQDLLPQLYLDPDAQALAEAGLAAPSAADDEVRVVDANGTPLATGDTVTLIKDLDVKGGGFTAKRGTTVKGIALTDDPKYVEGKVNGIRIVLVAAYLKKA